jgi:hypothetical protein
MARVSSNNKISITDPRASLEERCVAALSDHTIEARYLADLIIETEKSITEADVVATHLEEVSLDPEQSPDAARAREAAEFAAFVVKRLANILPRLQQAHQRVTARERSARWSAAADQV